jgi:hypothetical protein
VGVGLEVRLIAWESGDVPIVTWGTKYLIDGEQRLSWISRETTKVRLVRKT